MEDEAVLDRGAAFVKHICDEEEVEGEHDHSRCTNVASLTQSENSSLALHLWFILHYYEDSPKEKRVNQALCVPVWGVYAAEDASDFPAWEQNDLFGYSEEAWLTTEVSTR